MTPRVTAEQSLSGDLPIETPGIVVGNDSHRARISAAVTDVAMTGDGQAEVTVEVRHQGLTEFAFEPNPTVTVEIDGSVAFDQLVVNEDGTGTLHKDKTVTFTTALGDGDHQVCVGIEAPGFNPEFN